VVTQEHSSWPNAMFLRHLQHTLVLEQRRACASQWTVSGDVDALVFAEINDFLLGQQRVVFDLVDGGRDGGFCEELLHVFDRVVCDADGLYFVGMGLDEFLHVEPCLHVRVLVVDVARAVFELGEERVVSWGCQHTRGGVWEWCNTPLGFMGTGQWTR
jgi:hypothetical protein